MNLIVHTLIAQPEMMIITFGHFRPIIITAQSYYFTYKNSAFRFTFATSLCDHRFEILRNGCIYMTANKDMNHTSLY